MMRRYVIDTVALINYLNDIWNENAKLEKHTREIITKCLEDSFAEYRLVIPTIVIVEIFDKFSSNENIISQFRRFYYDKLKDNQNVELKPLEKDVLVILNSINEIYSPLEVKDKIVLSSAIELECTLITNDPRIIKYIDNVYNQIDVIF